MVKKRLLNGKEKNKNGAARLEKISMDDVYGEGKKSQNSVYERFTSLHFINGGNFVTVV